MRDNCLDDNRLYGTNLHLDGSGFSVHHIDSVRAMCGTALGVNGSDFSIYSNWIAYNGRDKFEGVLNFPWADGLTLANCTNGNVWGNILENNSDVEIMVGGGQGCQVHDNTIWHRNGVGAATYAYAGLMIGYFNEGQGDHTGSQFWANRIESDYNKLGFGLLVGPHPWNSDQWVTNGGIVSDHTIITGAQTNLAIDGMMNGTVVGNTPSGPQGTESVKEGYYCSIPENYTAFDHGIATIQQTPPPACKFYHNDGCFYCQP